MHTKSTYTHTHTHNPRYWHEERSGAGQAWNHLFLPGFNISYFLIHSRETGCPFQQSWPWPLEYTPALFQTLAVHFSAQEPALPAHVVDWECPGINTTLPTPSLPTMAAAPDAWWKLEDKQPSSFAHGWDNSDRRVFYTGSQDRPSVAPSGNWLDNTPIFTAFLSPLQPPFLRLSLTSPFSVTWDHILNKLFALESLPKNYLLEESKPWLFEANSREVFSLILIKPH